MRILIIGGSGQDGYYLINYLIRKGHQVTLLYRNNWNQASENMININLKKIRVDEYSNESIKNILQKKFYDYVILVGAVVGNQKGRENPIKLYQTNMCTLFNVINSIQSLNNQPTLINFCSTDMTGETSFVNNPIFDPESIKVPPSTTYGLSRLHSFQYSQKIRSEKKISVFNMIFAMHESPLRQGDYVLSKIKKTINQYKQNGKVIKMNYGNLNIHVDIGSAKDFMHILGDIIEQDKVNQDFVIGTGKSKKIIEICYEVLKENNIDPNDAMHIREKEGKNIYYPIVDTKILMNEIGYCPQTISGENLVKI